MFNVKIKYYPTSVEQVQIFSESVRSKGEKVEVDLEKYWIERDKKMARNPFELDKDGKPTVTSLEIEDYERSLESSLSRTKNKLFDLVRCEMWEWFLTLTFNPERVDSFDYAETSKKLSDWLGYMRKKCPEMMYIVVPEQHESGRWHFHGLFSGIDKLAFVDSGKRDKKHRVIYNVGDYKLGYSTATKICDVLKATSYLTKYITKDLCELTKGKKRYWASRNIPKPIVEEYFVLMKKEDILECVGEKTRVKEVKTPFCDVVYVDAPIYTTNTP